MQTATSSAPTADAGSVTPAIPATTVNEPRIVNPPLTATVPVAGLDLTAELDQVQLALRDFRTVHGENPVGTNAEITRALMGDNLMSLC